MDHSASDAISCRRKLPCSQQHNGVMERCLLSRMIDDEIEMRNANDHETLARVSRLNSPNMIWREKVTQWCYDVVDHLNESRDLVFVAMNILDRYSALYMSSSTNERDYETAALTALFLAVRISGGRSLDAPDLVRMSRLGVTTQEIVQIGRIMTDALSWDIKILTPADFCNAFINLLPLSNNLCLHQSITDTCRYLVEISVCDVYFSGVCASKIAFAALVSTVSSSNMFQLPEEARLSLFDQINELTGLDNVAADIASLCARLHGIFNQSQESEQQGPHLIPVSDDDINTAVAVSRPVTTRVVSSERLFSSRPLSRSNKYLVVSVPTVHHNLNSKRPIILPPTEQTPKRTKKSIV